MIYASLLLLKNWMRFSTKKEFFLSIFIHTPLNIILIASIFSDGSLYNIFHNLKIGIIYFVSVYSFISGCVFFEIELFSGIMVSPTYCKYLYLSSRVIAGFFYCSFIIFISVIFFLSSGTFLSVVILLLTFISFCILGVGVSTKFGLKNEKNLNNYINLVVWLFAFFSPIVDGVYYKYLFPIYINLDTLPIDITRLFIVFTVGIILYLSSMKPNSKTQFVR